MQKSVAKAVDGATGKASKDSGKRAGGIFGSSFSGVVKKAGALGAAVAVGLAAKGGISRALNIENAQAKLKGLGNDSKAVSKIMDNALASVSGTSFGLGEAATTAAGAVAAGIKPGERLEKVLKSVSNSAASAGVGMDEMGAIYNKVASLGKAQNDVLQQVADKGIPIYQALGDQMGKTSEEVFAMATAGEIGFDQFEKAMTKASGTVATEMGKTFTGSMANLKAAFSRVGATVMTPFLELMRVGANKLIPIVDAVNKALKPIFEDIATGFSEMSKSFKDGESPKFASKIVTALALVGSVVGKTSRLVSRGFAEMKKSFNDGESPKFASPVLTAFAAVGAAAGKGARETTGGVRAMVAAFQDGGNDVTSSGLAGALESVGLIARSVFGAIKPTITGVVDAFKPLLPQLGQIVQGFSPLQLIVNALVPIAPQLSTAIVAIAQAFASVIPAVAEIATQLATTLVPILTNIISTAVPMLVQAIQVACTWLSTITTYVRENWDWLSKVAVGVLGAVGAYKALQSALSITKSVMGGFNTVLQAGRAVQQGYAAASYGMAGASYAASGAARAGAAVYKTQAVITKIAAGAQAAYSAVLTIAQGVFVKTAAAAKLFGRALKANPVMSIVAAVAALAGGLTVFFTKTETGKAMWASFMGALATAWAVVKPVFDQLMAALEPIFVQVATELMPAFRELGAAIIGLVQPLAQVVSQIVTALVPVISTLIASIVPLLGMLIAQLVPAISLVARIIGQVVAAFLPLVSTILSMVLPALGAIIIALTPVIKTVVELLIPVIKTILSVVSTVFKAIVPIIQAALKIVTGVIQTVTALIKGDWKGVWEGIKKIFSGVWDGIKTIVSAAVEIVRSVINGALTTISNLWNKAWGAIGDFLDGVWSNISKSVSDGIKGVTDFFGGLWGKVQDAIGDIGGNMLQVGKDMIDGLIKGITDMTGGIKDAVYKLISFLPQWAKDILGIHSPSRVFRSIGNFLGIGFADGINGTQKQVKNATTKLVQQTIDAFDKREEVVKKANAKIEKINAQLKALPEANQKAAKRVDKAQDKVKEAQAKLTAAKKAAASKLTQKESDALLKVQRAQEKVNAAAAKAGKKGQTKSQQAASAKALKTAQQQLADAKKAAGRSVSSSKQSAQNAVDSAKKSLASAKASLAEAKAAQKSTAAKSAAKAKDLKAQKAEAKGQKAAYGALNPKAKTALVKKLEAEQKALDGLAKKRDAVTAKLKTAQKNLEDLTKARSDYEGNIIDRLTGSGDVTDMGDSADAIIANLTKVKQGIDAFKKNVEALKKAGLNQDAIDQIVQAGPEAGNKTAEALLAGGADVIKQVNTLQGQIGASAKSMASVAGDAMYGAGIAAAQKTVAGLKSQEAIISAAMTEIANDMNKSVAKAMGIKPSAELAKQQKTAGQQSVAGIMAGVKAKTPELMQQMAKLAKDMAKKVKTALKIHSPSRLFADEVGEMIPAGIGEGVEAGADDLNAKVATLVQVPDVPAVTAAGGLDGTALPDAGLTQFGDTAVEVFADSTSALAGFLASAKAGVRGALVPVLTAARTATTGLGTTSAQMWAATAAKLTSSYRTGMKPSLDQLNTTLSKTLPASSQMARDASTAAWSGLSSSMGSTWTKGIKPTLDKASSALKNALPGAFRSGRTSSSDAFSGLKSDVTSTWTKGIRPQLDALGDFVTDTLPDSFESGVKAMRKAWDGLREATRKPVSFIISEVYNKGLRGVWNKVASQFGEKALPEFKPKGFYDGGRVTGPGTGRSDSIPARLSNGEFVVNATATRKWLPLLHKINGPRGAGYGQAYKDGGLVYPVAGGRPTSRFGVARSGYSHAGFDLAVPVGTAVRAALAGVVTKAGWNAVPGRTGIGMLLQHENGMATYYGHLSRTLAKVGDQVAQGAQIALSGNTGRSTGPHLHFETWVDGKPVDPERLLKGAPLPVGGSGLSPEETLESLSAPFKELTKGLGAMPSAGQFSELLTAGSQRMLEAPLAWMKANLDKLISGDVDGGDGITQGKGSIKEQVRAVAKSFGWGDGEQWAALDWLVSHESSWNPNARNPKSSAAGLFQKMQSLNGPVESTPAGQAQWGLKYIKGRYGNPVNAKSFWQKHHWYRDGGAVRPELHDQGGWLKPGLTSVLNATRRPEAILNPSQWRAAEAAINLAVQGQGFPDTLTLSVDGQQFTAYVSGVTDARLAHHADGLRQVSRQYAGARR